MSVERNREIVRASFERAASGDRSGAYDIFDPDAVIVTLGTTPASGRFVRSGEDYAARARQLGEILPEGVQFQLDDLIGEGDTVVALVRGFATTASGMSYNNTYAMVFRFDEAGKVIELIEYGDTALIETALFEKTIS